MPARAAGVRELESSRGEECLARELREELGIEVAIGELVETLTHEYPEKTVHLKFFRCQWKQNEARPLGCSDFKWIGQEDLAMYDFPAADARLLDKLRSSPVFWSNNPAIP